MSPKKAYTFLIDPELLEALKVLKDRDAAPESETIRRALREYLKKKGVKADRKRAATRKRP
jgi:metal-responsive CopG/Arc/MetJ family transcriptional regulator